MRSTPCDTFSHNRDSFYVSLHKWLQIVYSVNIMPESTVHSWVHRFYEEKQENIHNDKRSG